MVSFIEDIWQEWPIQRGSRGRRARQSMIRTVGLSPLYRVYRESIQAIVYTKVLPSTQPPLFLPSHTAHTNTQTQTIYRSIDSVNTLLSLAIGNSKVFGRHTTKQTHSHIYIYISVYNASCSSKENEDRLHHNDTISIHIDRYLSVYINGIASEIGSMDERKKTSSII